MTYDTIGNDKTADVNFLVPFLLVACGMKW